VLVKDDDKRTLRERVARLESLLEAVLWDKSTDVDINNTINLQRDLVSDVNEISDYEQANGRITGPPLVSIIRDQQVRVTFPLAMPHSILRSPEIFFSPVY
jgi:hypothetical protein